MFLYDEMRALRLDEAVETDGADWSAALRNEHVGVLGVIAP
jgi:hypothetical protein